MIYQALTNHIIDETPGVGLFYGVRTLHFTFLLYKNISVGSKMIKLRNIALSLINKIKSLEQNKMVSLQVINSLCSFASI